jgi:hypothetical protein
LRPRSFKDWRATEEEEDKRRWRRRKVEDDRDSE